MRTGIVLAVVCVLVLAATGGYYGLEMYSGHQFRAGLDQALATLPSGTTASYKSAHYAVVSRRAVVTGFAIHGEIPGNPPQPFDLTVDSVETENPNLDMPNVWAGAMANPAATAQDKAFPVADSVTLTGVTLHSSIANLSEETFRIAKPRIYPWALLHDGMPSWHDIQASVQPRPQPPQLADMGPLLRAEAGVLLGVGYDGYEAGAAKFTETLPGIDFNYDLRKVSGGAFDRGIIQGGSGDGISLHGNKLGAFSVDRVTIGATDFRAPLIQLINGAPVSAALLDGIRIGRIEYRQMTVQAPGQKPVSVGAISVGPVVFAQGMPVSGECAMTDFQLSRSQLPEAQARDAFDKLGLETMTISFAVAYNWDVTRRHVSVHDTMLKVNELGTMTLSADLANIVANAAALGGAQLAHARLRFDDASLTDRLLKAGATQSGADPAAFRQQVLGIVRQQSMAGGNGNPVLLAAGRSAVDFLTSPRSLTIELSPPAPVPLIALQGQGTDPGRLAAAIGLTVTANQ